MKKAISIILFLFHFCILLSSLSAENLYNYISSNSALFYNFDEAEGSKLIDRTGNNNNAVIQTPRFLFSEGRSKFGISTGKTTKSMIVPHSEALEMGKSFTIMFWVKPKSFGDKNKLVSKRSNTKLQSFFALGEDMGKMYAAFGQGKDFVVTEKTAQLQIGKWQHIAFSLDHLKKQMTLYLNGVQVYKGNCPYTLSNSNASLCIGGDLEGSSHFFEGVFDDFLVCKASLTENDISQYYTNMLSTSNNKIISESLKSESVELYFPLNEYKGNKFFNIIPNNNFGKITGNGINWVEGIKSGSISFSKSLDHAEIYYTNSNAFENDFSINFWINAKSNEKNQTILSLKSSASKEQSSILMQIDKENLTCEVTTSGKSETLTIKDQLLPYSWQMVTLTYKKSLNELSLFIGARGLQTTTLKKPLNLKQPKLFIGSNETKKRNPLIASIDEFIVYSKTLSETEAQKAMTKNPFSFMKGYFNFPFDPEAKKLIAYYSFDNGTSKFIENLSSAKIHGKIEAKKNTSIFTAGHSGTAANFDGFKTKLKIPSTHYTDNMTSFTFSFHVYPELLKGEETLLSRASLENKNKILLFGLNNGKPFLNLGDGLSTFSCEAETALAKDKWQHLVVTFDFIDGEISFYNDGKLIKREKSNTPISGLLGIPTLIGSAPQKLSFKGKIDEVMLFASSLSPSDIIAIKNIAKRTPPQKRLQKISTTPVIDKPDISEKSSVEAPSKKLDQSKTLLIKQPPVRHPTKPAKSKAQKTTKKGIPSSNFDFTKLYHSLPRSQTKLNLIPFYKRHRLLFHYAFEGKDLNKIMDETSSSSVFSLNSDDSSPLIPGYKGNGLFINDQTFISISQIMLRTPLNCSIEFFIFPLELADNSYKSIFQILNSMGEPVVNILNFKGRLYVKTKDSDPIRTNTLLMEKYWQNLLLCFNSEQKLLSIKKNHVKFDEIEINVRIPRDITFTFGKTTKHDSTLFVLDDVVAYNNNLTDVTPFPGYPTNPAIQIKEGKKIIEDKFTLLLFCENATEYMISYQKDFMDSRWKPFTNKVSLPTKQFSGTHTIYVKFRNDSYLETDIISYDYNWGTKEIEFINPLPDSIIPGKR